MAKKRQTHTKTSQQKAANIFARWREYLPHTFMQRFWAGAATLSVLLLWLSCALVYISPDKVGYLALLPLAFPLLLIGTGGMVVLLLLFSRKLTWIALLGLLVCLPFVRTYAPINLPSPAPKQSIKVMSWNVFAFWGKDLTRKVGNKTVSPTVEYIAEHHPDIVCLQEAYDDTPGFMRRYLRPALRPHLPYYSFTRTGDSGLVCMSHYKIIKKEVITQVHNNGAVAYWMERGQEDTLLVINAHLRSMGLSGTDRKIFHEGVTGKGEKAMLPTFERMIRKLKDATQSRGKMADAVAQFIAQHQHLPLIVCGDFNDTPISYTRYKVAEGLTDAYRSTGNGYGRSFRKDAILVRIDHMLCSKDVRPFGCYIDKGTLRSDHYPIVGHFLLPTKK